ncbi:glutamine synthetase [Pseudohyphozyma bogoriensis]|nr:glutamine synthetase [Pseudohyphozyma bogoriensis]
MTTVTPPRTLDELKALLVNDTKVQVAGVDVDGVLRGKIMVKDKFLSSAKDGGFGFCSVTFGWDMHDRTYTKELSISTLANGYKDLIARIDFDTYRRTPTTPSLPFFMLTFIDPDTSEPLFTCPRGLLQKVISEFEAEGMSPYAGAEYEYFNYEETPKTAAAKKYSDLTPLTEGMHGYSLLRPMLNNDYFHDLYDSAASFGIPLEGHHTETGPGVYESALAYQNAARMADNAILFKWIAKITGYKYGVMPTFMAKPYSDQPGCSGHVHFSLRDSSGKNIFAVEESELKDGRVGASYEDTKRISVVAEHFLAGVLLGLPEIMPCLVPTVNGYKRLVESYWAPVNVSYAYENRVASVRIISPPLAAPSATRLEVRVPGADMNPYFTFSAVLACGLYGIKNKLPLSQPPLNTASTNGQLPPDLVRLPKTLGAAADKMGAKDSLARKVLGDKFVDHYVATREHEWNLSCQAVTDWEKQRYFELA